MNEALAQRFVALYAQFDRAGIEQLPLLYESNVVFTDPFHRIDGLVALQNCFYALCQNIEQLRFVCDEPLVGDNAAYIRWQLFFSQPRLNGGREIVVPGVSFIRGMDKIDYHEDFYDAGALLYEHLPLLGAGVRFIKRRMQRAGGFE